MLLKVGELAKRAGLTVRTLHHYDHIGLLRPSARSDSGFRLYNRDDVKRLHRIQALKQFGCALEDIKLFLEEPGGSVLAVVEKQLEVLRVQAERAQALHGRLQRLREQLRHGEETGLTDWLAILEMMTAYEKHLSKKDLDTIFAKKADGLDQELARLAASAEECMARGLPPESAEAREIAWRWIRCLKEMTGDDAGLAAKLGEMWREEEMDFRGLGKNTSVPNYLSDAFAEARLAILARYLTPEELDGVRRRQAEHLREWMPLIAQFARLMDEGAAPEDPAVQALARRWQELFRASFSGDDAQLEEKIRIAVQQEPDLRMGIGIDRRFMQFREKAVMHLQQQEKQSKDPAPASASALRVATLRATHQLVDVPPVFVDPLALKILGAREEKRLRDDPEAFDKPLLKGIRASVVLRSRLAEDEWARSEHQGVRQYVILGAGLDTFAYRKENQGDSRIFEVDLPATQAWKRERLLAAGIPEPAHLSYISVDFERQSLLETLMRGRFRKDSPAFFSWLGVTMYLAEDAVFATLASIAALPPGSGVVFDYAVALSQLSPRERQAREALAARTAQGGEVWKTDFVPAALVGRLRALGFHEVEEYGPDRLNAMYLAGRGDGLKKSGVSRLICARVGL